MTHAAIYARYSSEGQKESSIEDQVRNCQRWAEREGLEIVQRYQESAISGSTAERRRTRMPRSCPLCRH